MGNTLPALFQRMSDDIAIALVTISVDRHQIHQGLSFLTGAVKTSMADTSTIILAFKTPPGTRRAHMSFKFSSLLGAHVDVIEAPTWDNQSGTLNPIFNRKRESAMTSSTLLEDSGQAAFTATDNVILDPTGLAGGLTVVSIFGFGDKKAFPGTGVDPSEGILMPDTQYALVFTADGGPANQGQLALRWHEQKDGE